MRIFFLIILGLFASSTSFAHEDKEAHELECNGEAHRPGEIHRAYFSSEELEAIKYIQKLESPVLFEALNTSPGMNNSIDQEKAIPIEWDQAKRLILMGYAKSVLQGSLPEPHAYILSSKATYVATPPESETVYILADVVDPCGIYITRVMY